MRQNLLVFFPIWALCAVTLPAQDVTTWGLLPEFQVSWAQTERTDLFLQLESQTYWLESSEGAVNNDFFVRNLNLNFGLSHDLGTEWNFAASFLVRSRQPFTDKPGWELRPRFQLSHIFRTGKYRLGNRLRADNRFEQRQQGEEWGFNLRLRYRLSADFPLQGERLDVGELYLNSSTELLLTVTETDFWFYRNLRGYAGLGYQLTPHNRLESGLEFRTGNDDPDGSDEHIVFWRLTWVMGL